MFAILTLLRHLYRCNWTVRKLRESLWTYVYTHCIQPNEIDFTFVLTWQWIWNFLKEIDMLSNQWKTLFYMQFRVCVFVSVFIYSTSIRINLYYRFYFIIINNKTKKQKKKYDFFDGSESIKIYELSNWISCFF